MNFEERQDYDKAVDDMLKEKLKIGLPFAIFAIVILIGVLGALAYIAFN